MIYLIVISLTDTSKSKYYIYDPWLGEYSIGEKYLDSIWSPRDYDGFVVKGKERISSFSAKIEKIIPIDKEKIINMCSIIFSDVMTYEENIEYISGRKIDWEDSVKLVYNNQIVGCYLFDIANIDDKEPGKGIEGVSIAIKPAFRNYGYGEKLKNWLENWAKNNGYNYVWGTHLKGLHNIEQWTKRREIYKEDDELFYTIKRLK